MLFAVIAGIGIVVHFAMAAMVMREARAAGENPMAWGMIAFSRPFVGYAMWKSQGRGRGGGPTPMIGMGMGGPGMNPYGPPGMGWPQSGPVDTDDAPFNQGASTPPPPPDPTPPQSSIGSDSTGTGQINSF